MLNLDALKTLSDIINNFLTIIALLVGGVWTYYNFIKGRLYKNRLEPKVDAQFVKHNQGTGLLISYQVKNVGLSKVPIKQEGSAIEIFTCDLSQYNPHHESIIWDDLTILSIFIKHQWIEPGETIEEQQLINLVKEESIAVKITLKLVSKQRVEWNAVKIVPVKTS